MPYSCIVPKAIFGAIVLPLRKELMAFMTNDPDTWRCDQWMDMTLVAFSNILMIWCQVSIMMPLFGRKTDCDARRGFVVAGYLSRILVTTQTESVLENTYSIQPVNEWCYHPRIDLIDTSCWWIVGLTDSPLRNSSLRQFSNWLQNSWFQLFLAFEKGACHPPNWKRRLLTYLNTSEGRWTTNLTTKANIIPDPSDTSSIKTTI